MSIQHKQIANIAIVKILMLVFIVAMLAGCGKNLTDAQYVEKAKEHLTKNHRNSAIIELKNALQQNANNKDARMLLAELYIDMGNYIAAGKELQRAMELGVPQKKLAFSRAKMLIGVGKYKDVLSDIRVKDDYPPELKAELYYYRGKAQLNLANIQLIPEAPR